MKMQDLWFVFCVAVLVSLFWLIQSWATSFDRMGVMP